MFASRVVVRIWLIPRTVLELTGVLWVIPRTVLALPGVLVAVPVATIPPG